MTLVLFEYHNKQVMVFFFVYEHFFLVQTQDSTFTESLLKLINHIVWYLLLSSEVDCRAIFFEIDGSSLFGLRHVTDNIQERPFIVRTKNNI